MHIPRSSFREISGSTAEQIGGKRYSEITNKKNLFSASLLPSQYYQAKNKVGNSFQLLTEKKSSLVLSDL